VAFVVLATVAASVFIVACGGSDSSTPPAAKSTPAPGTTAGAIQADVSASGDIPDNQVFVTYHSSAAGYSLDVPEGWARTESGENVNFSDKFNSVRVDVTASSAPTINNAKLTEIPALQAANKGFQEIETQSVDVRGTQVVRIRYRADSSPDVVTGKTLTLETDRYLFYANGHVAAVSLSSPVGADNVDAWNQIARNFKWD